ncbi:MAG: hypothetical protein WA790_13480 [Sulfitobacter sp.]
MRLFDALRRVAIALMLQLILASPATAQYFSEKGSEELTLIVPFNDDIRTRNKVLIYTNVAQENNAFFYVARNFKIRFLGLHGESEDMLLMDHYMGQVWHQDNALGTSVTSLPPYSTPYSSAKTVQAGAIDLHDIPIPASIGPIVGVMLITPGNYDWKIDKIVVDGRSFVFDPSYGKQGFRRYASHFILGQSTGDYTPLATPFKTTYRALISKANNRQGITVQSDLWNSKESVAKQDASAYDATQTYSEPTRPEHQKSVTVRVAFDGLSNSGLQVGPVLDLTLVSRNGRKSKQQRTTGPLLFGEKFVTFKDIPGDFKVDSVQLKLVTLDIPECDRNRSLRCGPKNDAQSADITELSILIEEALTPELIFNGTAKLSENGQTTATILRNSFRGGVLLSELGNTATQETLLARSAAQTFSPLGNTDAERAVIERVITQHKVDDIAFETWFRDVADFEVDVTTILRDIEDELGAYNLTTAQQDLWHDVLKARFFHALTDRKNALKVFLRLEAGLEDSYKDFTTELFAMDQFFGLATGQRVRNAPKAVVKEDHTLGFLETTFGILSSVSEAAGPEGEIASTVFSVLGGLTNIVGKLIDDPDEDIPDGFVDQTIIDDTGNQNKLSIMAANERLDLLQQRKKTLVAMAKARALVLRDLSLLQELAQVQVDYTLNIAPIGSASDANLEMRDALGKEFKQKSQTAIRTYLVRKYLPVRGTIYGKPVISDRKSVARGLFPPRQEWPAQRDVARSKACSDGCDGVLAFSGNILPIVHNNLFHWLREYETQHYEWHLALGGTGAEGIKLAAEVSVSSQRIKSTWDYVTSVITPEDAFYLIALQDEPSIQVSQRNYVYGLKRYYFNAAEPPVPNFYGTYGFSKTATRIDKPLPSWPPGSNSGVTVRDIGNAPMRAIDQLCQRANVTNQARPIFGEPEINPTCVRSIKGVRDLPGRPVQGMVTLRYMTYDYTDGDVKDTVVVPGAWVVLD